MFDWNVGEVVVVLLLLAGLAWLLRYTFVTRPRNQVNEADQYIARLNAAAAQHQRNEADRAARIREATNQRTAAARRATEGRAAEGRAGHDQERRRQ
jgi:cytoskeletal protein RodZ